MMWWQCRTLRLYLKEEVYALVQFLLWYLMIYGEYTLRI